MYGQMTAGSWAYIGTQGIIQGTYETLAEAASPRRGTDDETTVSAERSSSPAVSAAWAAHNRSPSR